jgi:hypothetical protein
MSLVFFTDMCRKKLVAVMLVRSFRTAVFYAVCMEDEPMLCIADCMYACLVSKMLKMESEMESGE